MCKLGALWVVATINSKFIKPKFTQTITTLGLFSIQFELIQRKQLNYSKETIILLFI